MTAINPQNKESDAAQQAQEMLAHIEDKRALRFLLICIQILAGWQFRKQQAKDQRTR